LFLEQKKEFSNGPENGAIFPGIYRVKNLSVSTTHSQKEAQIWSAERNE
jgi:hypothetical protein